MEQRLHCLKMCALWEGTKEEYMNWVAERCEEQTYRPGEIICSKSRFATGISMILSGKAYTSKSSIEGRKMPMSALNYGDIFGAVTLFGGSTHFETDIYAGPQGCTVLFLKKDHVLEIMHYDFRIAENYMGYLCSRVRFLSSRVDALVGVDGKSKLLSYLYHNADEEGRVEVKGSKGELAAKLSISRATLYRAMDSLEEEGSIRREGKDIWLL
ncbi:MAG: Crp/Fnr family transcriptional regulator [Clostridiales bacterium]|nr:Crp/Fnr family transcriptional regulator [Clostridiales bacterium]